MRFLGPTALLSRLDRALEASGARDLPERRRTMRATLDWGATNWSYDLLSEPEKDLFARLSVFAGGFDLEPAETVGENRESDEEDVLLGSPSSWRNPARGGGGLRYRMLEPVRQYARKRLDEGGEEYETGRRHAAYCLSLAERARPKLQGREEGEWPDRLEARNDNLRAVIGWSLECGDE